MSGAVCPSCGVAVVPGYVRCPKCGKALPRRAASVVGGTALADKRRFPVLALVAAAFAAIAVTIYIGLRGSENNVTQPPEEEESPEEIAADNEPITADEQPEAPAAPTAPSAIDVAASLERALKRQRLWSTVSVIGGRVDVRSGSCADPAMAPLLDTAVPSFKAAGLTRLRCLEQSGRVVTERDL